MTKYRSSEAKDAVMKSDFHLCAFADEGKQKTKTATKNQGHRQRKLNLKTFEALLVAVCVYR